MIQDNGTAKNHILAGFIELMSEKPYPDITVTDVVKKAGVARVSFYRNFTSVADLAEIVTDDFVNDFLNEIYPLLTIGSDEQKWRTVLRRYFENLLIKKSSFTTMQKLNSTYIFSMVEEKMSALSKFQREETAKGKYIAAGKMGLIQSIGTCWLRSDSRESVEDMVEMIMKFITTF